MCIAKSTIATLGHHCLLSILSEVNHQLATSGHQRTNRYFDEEWFTAPATLVAFGTGLAALGRQLRFVAKVQQGIEVFCSTKHDVTATPAIATVWAAFVYVFLMTKTHGTVAALPRFHFHCCDINKHVSILPENRLFDEAVYFYQLPSD